MTKATIHHYCALGLLPAPVKTAHNMAYYAPDCVERVEVVRALAERHLPLAEVRAAIDEHGLEALHAILARTAEAGANLVHLIGGQAPRMTRAQLIEESGLDPEDIKYLESLGLLRRDGAQPSGHGQAAEKAELYDSLSVELVQALARMREAGMTEAIGFFPRDVRLYHQAMAAVVQSELSYFDSRLIRHVPPEDAAAVMNAALEHAEQLCVIVRRRLLLDALQQTESGTRNPVHTISHTRRQHP